MHTLTCKLCEDKFTVTEQEKNCLCGTVHAILVKDSPASDGLKWWFGKTIDTNVWIVPNIVDLTNSPTNTFQELNI